MLLISLVKFYNLNIAFVDGKCVDASLFGPRRLLIVLCDDLD